MERVGGLRTGDIVSLHQRTFSVLTATPLGLLSFPGLSRSSCVSVCPGADRPPLNLHLTGLCLSVSRVGQRLPSSTLYPPSQDSSKQSIEGAREAV